jgi:hypothetical protein
MTCARRPWVEAHEGPPEVMSFRCTRAVPTNTGAALARQYTGTVLPTLGSQTLEIVRDPGQHASSADRQRCRELILHPLYAQYPRQGSVAFIDLPSPCPRHRILRG